MKRKCFGGGFGPGYNPPNSEYAEINLKGISKKKIFSIMGKGGEVFKKWTQEFNVQYIWFNVNKKVLEIWGDVNNVNIAKQNIISLHFNN